MSEPIWRAGLSVAQYCVDRDVAIHAISKNYEQYDPDETEKKANRIKGPYGCATFEKFNPGGCDECIHKGKIKSPILLGLEIAEATTNEIIEEAKDDEPAIVHSVPEYPFPYFRGKAGVFISVRSRRRKTRRLCTNTIFMSSEGWCIRLKARWLCSNFIYHRME